MKKIEFFVTLQKSGEIEKLRKKLGWTRAEFLRRALDNFLPIIRMDIEKSEKAEK